MPKVFGLWIMDFGFWILDSRIFQGTLGKTRNFRKNKEL